MKGPRRGRYAEKPGNYELAIRVMNPTANPGDVISIELYITGYGLVSNPKLAFFSPTNFIHPTESVAISGMQEIIHENKRAIVFGGSTDIIGETGNIVLTFKGLGSTDWKECTYFVDRNLYGGFFDIDHCPAILTECNAGQAPIEMKLRTIKKVKTGKHNLRFYLTYFNGAEWKTSIDEAEIDVPNLYKRNEITFWLLGVFIATVLACVPVVLDKKDKNQSGTNNKKSTFPQIKDGSEIKKSGPMIPQKSQ